MPDYFSSHLHRMLDQCTEISVLKCTIPQLRMRLCTMVTGSRISLYGPHLFCFV